MKKMFKSRIFLVLATAIIVGSIGVYATGQILASDVDYKNGKKVSQALDELYTKANNNVPCEEWTEIENSTANNESYSYNSEAIKLYKCGNICKITFALRVSDNSEVQLITNSNYFPKEEVSYNGIGAEGGYSQGKLLTNGNILVTYSNNGKWTSSENVAFICQ